MKIHQPTAPDAPQARSKPVAGFFLHNRARTTAARNAQPTGAAFSAAATLKGTATGGKERRASDRTTGEQTTARRTFCTAEQADGQAADRRAQLRAERGRQARQARPGAFTAGGQNAEPHRDAAPCRTHDATARARMRGRRADKPRFPDTERRTTANTGNRRQHRDDGRRKNRLTTESK